MKNFIIIFFKIYKIIININYLFITKKKILLKIKITLKKFKIDINFLIFFNNNNNNLIIINIIILKQNQKAFIFHSDRHIGQVSFP